MQFPNHLFSSIYLEFRECSSYILWLISFLPAALGQPVGQSRCKTLHSHSVFVMKGEFICDWYSYLITGLPKCEEIWLTRCLWFKKSIICRLKSMSQLAQENSSIKSGPANLPKYPGLKSSNFHFSIRRQRIHRLLSSGVSVWFLSSFRAKTAPAGFKQLALFGGTGSSSRLRIQSTKIRE